MNGQPRNPYADAAGAKQGGSQVVNVIDGETKGAGGQPRVVDRAALLANVAVPSPSKQNPQNPYLTSAKGHLVFFFFFSLSLLLLRGRSHHRADSTRGKSRGGAAGAAAAPGSAEQQVEKPPPPPPPPPKQEEPDDPAAETTGNEVFVLESAPQGASQKETLSAREGADGFLPDAGGAAVLPGAGGAAEGVAQGQSGAGAASGIGDLELQIEDWSWRLQTLVGASAC